MRFLSLMALAAVAAGVVFLLSTFQPSTARAQGASTSSVAITTSQASVYEGGLAVFQLIRTGGYDSEVTVKVKTWEPDHVDAFGVNETDQVHDITFPVGVRIATLQLSSYRDDWFDVGELILKAQVQASADGDYTVADDDTASIPVIDVHQIPQGLSSVSLSVDDDEATEGDTVTFTLTRSGDTANPLTVNINVEDPEGFLRGNHWDEPPDIPTSVEFPGGTGTQTQTVTLDIPDDQRDITDGKIKLRVLPSHDYLLAPGVNDSGLRLLKTVDVTDDDTPQELELNFGKDGVDGVHGAEGDAFKIVVKRRPQDAGQTATLTVRVEAERSGADQFLEEWERLGNTSRRYKDFHLEITGSDTQVEQVIEIVENGVAEALMTYTADIRTLEDHEGNALTDEEEALYWTVKTDFRGTAISPSDNGAKTGTITLTTDQTTAVEGQEVIFTVSREGGPVSRATTATVETSEEGRETTTDGVTTNPSLQEHEVPFEPWQTTATLRVYPYVDMTAETGADPLDAEITSVGTGYTIGSPSTATVEINDAPSTATTLSLQFGSGTTPDPDDANATTIDEGGSVSFSVTRTGSTTQDLTVGIEVDDPQEMLRGNHWDPAPDIPSEIIIPAGDTNATFTLNAPDDQRDVTDGMLGVRLLASEDYYLGAPGLNSPFTVNVTDNDTAQRLTFQWGHLDSYAETSWEQGESWNDDAGDDGFTPGPAEGLFYYEDNRNFLFHDELDEAWPAHFRIRRRAADTGKTATFTVRVEHNRGWVSARHTDWQVDPVTGNHYKDFELTLTGDQRQVVGRVAIGDNGWPDHDDWQHSARIIKITDAQTGEELTGEQEAQYWRVNSQGNNYRENSIQPNDRGWPEYNFLEATPDPVAEGGEVTFTLQRQRGDVFEPLEIQVRTWEPNLTNPDGTNPSDQLHTVTFPAEEMTTLHQQGADQTQTITVTTTQDNIYETSDVIKAEIPANIDRYKRSDDSIQAAITDDDQPTITLSADRTTATEGETVTFTLTRGNNTTQDLIVGVQVDDPGGFLQGNSASQAVEVPSSVSFAPGDATKEIAITPPDDWRDIPDSTLTFTLAQEPEYEIIGSDTLTVQLSDNDVAPQVGISFVQTPVDENEELVLVATRTGETKNPLEIPVTSGPVGDQRYMVLVMDAGSSEIRLTVNELDNDVKGPDVVYKATLHPEPPEFWTPTGATTVTGTVLDDDVYLVGVEAQETAVDEGQLLPFRYFHNGHTEEGLRINLERSQDGSAVKEALVNETGVFYNIPAGSSDWEIAYIAQWQDGSDGDAVFTVEILPGDGYEIDPDHASASITVRDTDPLPVISFPGLGDYVDEGDGTAEIDVDLASSVPVIRTVTVDYEVTGATAEDIDLTNATGTLEFPSGTTQVTIEVPIVQDNLAEGNEQFNIVLSNPAGAVLQDERASLSYRVIIQDDEAEVSVEAAGADSDNELAVDEGTDIVLTLTRTEDTTEALDAWLQVVDRREPVSITYPKVTFSAGSDTAEYTIETVDDQDDLGNYEITVTVAEPARVGEPRTYHKDYTATIVTVRDNELPRVRVYPASSEDEGDGGIYGTAYNYIPLPPNNTEGDNLYFLFQRNNGGPELTVDLEWEGATGFASGTLPATAVLARGERELTLTIPTEDDAVAEDNGDITVTVKDGSGYIAGNPDTASHWIYDNDGDLPELRITAERPWVNEGEDVVFTVTRTGDTTAALDVNLLLFHTRSGGDHQTTEEDTITIAAGSDSGTITKSTTDDQINYGNASIVAALMPGEYYLDRSTVEQALQDTGQNVFNHIRVWVQDDDRPTVTLGPATTEYEEGDPMEVTIGRTGDTTVQLYVDTSVEITRKYPAPLQDETRLSRNAFTQVSAGESSSTRRFADTGTVGALGATGRIWLVPDSCPDDAADCGEARHPHVCIDDPGQNAANCGYQPQYFRDGTQYQQDFVIHNDFMGVRIEADQSTVAEGTAATFTLHRHGGAPGSLAKTLEVQVQVTQEGDYISGSTPETVTFAANTATATLTVDTDDDALDELDGTITATLLRPSSCNNELNCYAIGEYPGSVWEVTEVTTAVTDDDYLLPTVSIADALGKEPDGAIEFTVTLDAPNTQEIVTVSWATAADGNATTDTAATSGTDYTAASGTLTFAIGEAEKTISVALLDDHEDEYHETFSVTLSSPQNAVLGDATATGTIRDDEQDFAVIFYRWTQSAVEGEELGYTIRRLPPLTPGETLSSGDACFDEPDDLACFNESLDADTGNIPLTINIKVTESGDMISGTTPTTVTFEPDAIFYDLVIPTRDDAVLEASSVVTIQVLDGAGYSAGYTHVDIVSADDVPTVLTTVYDNDLTFSIGDVSASESAGALDFTIELNAPAPEEISIDVATEDGDATSYAFVTASSLGQDYTARSETVTFLAGEQTRTFSVSVEDDTIQERDETFSVVLSNPPPYTTLLNDTATGTIIDDEASLVARVYRAYGLANEDQSGPVRFMVELSHPDTTTHERNPAVAWKTTAGTATADEDYHAAEGKLTFPVGTTMGFVDVQLIDDNLLEAELETLSVDLDGQDTRLVSISPTEGSYEVNIRDDESMTAFVTAVTENVAEGQDAVFAVTLYGGVPSEDVSVHFETGGTADEVDDYGTPFGDITFPAGDTTGRSGSLTIPAGETTGAITYPILTDSLEEYDETLEVVLFSATSSVRIGTINQYASTATAYIQDEDTLIVSIEGTPSVAEGGTATFTITLSTASDETVSVGWTTDEPGEAVADDQKAKPNEDFNADDGTVAIPAGSTSVTLTVPTTDDTLVEKTEYFRVVLQEATKGSGVPAEMVPLGATYATGAVTDDDAAPDGISVSVDTTNIAESAGAWPLSVTVSLDGTTQFSHDTPVTIEFINRPNVAKNAELGVDYTADRVETTIRAGRSSVTKTVTFTLIEDNIAEGDEIARLTAKSPALSNGDALGITIEDNDPEPVEVVLAVTPVTLTESSGATSLTVTATLSGSSLLPVDTVVSLMATGDTATEGTDFQAAAGTLTIPAGKLTANGALTLTVQEDTIDEEDETLEITGTVPGTMDVVAAGVTIQDNDPPPTGIGLSATASLITEGGAAVDLTVEATLLGGGTRTQDTQVDLELTDLTATVDDDYTASWTTQTITIPAGEFSASVTLTITTVDDTLYEGAEYVSVRAENTDPGLPVNGIRFTIEDDDPEPTTIALSLSKEEVSETAGVALLDVTATLEGDSTLTTDTTIFSQVANPRNSGRTYFGYFLDDLKIDAGESTGKVTLVIIDINDHVDDDDETVTIRGMASDPTLKVTEATLTITDDDSYGVSINPTSLSVTEGLRTSYTVKLNSEPTSAVTVFINLPPNAGFTVTPGHVTFTPQRWGSKTVIVQGTQDADAADEPAATITHTITTSDNKYRNATTDDVSVTVRDDDEPAVTVSFGAATYTVAESDDANTSNVTENEVEVMVKLDVDPERQVVIPLVKTEQDGTSSADYSGVPTSITFESGDTEKSFTFTGSHDTDDDDGESVKLTFGTLPTDVSEGAIKEAVISIADDDVTAVTVSFEQGSYTVAESDDADTTNATENEETVKVILSADPKRTVTIPVSKTEQGGASASDYSGVPSSVTFNSGDTEKTFSFAASSDNVDDDDESVKLTFGALPTGVSEGTTKETVISITDDDVPQVTVSFENATYSVAESDDVDTIDVTENEVTVKVKLSADPERTVTVPISKTNQDGASDADYSGVPASVVFNSGDTEKSFTFTAAHDTVDDDDEKVKLTFGTLPARVSEGTTKETVISINDDDVPQVTVSFGATGYTVDEGSTVAVKVKLNKDPERTVAVPLTITHFDGVSGADYSGIPGSVTFQAGDTEKSFSFAATQDTVDDDGEYVLIGLGNLPHRVTTAAPSQTTVSITDDDVPAVTVNFGQASHTVAESDDADTSDVTENSVTITVKLDVDPGRTVTIPIIKNNQGGATAADYTGVPASVVFNSGETEKTFDFTATSDTVDDDDESVKLTFGALPAGVSEGTTKETVISITDDDDPAVTVSFGSAAYSVAETDDASTTDATENEVVIKVTLSADPERTVTIPITKNNQGGASSADYSGVPVSLEFNSGDTEKSFTFSATHDTVDDDDESVKLTFGTLPTGVSEGTTKEAVVSINDDDVPTVTVSFEKTAYSVDEGSSETIKVILSAKPERAVAITVAATLLDGAGVPDFTGAPATLNFGKDDTEKTITFAAYDDTLDDDGEGVRLTFAPLPTRVNAGTNSQATVSIVDDDDPAVTVSFGEAAYTVAESDDPDTSDVDENEVVIKVKLSADPERQVTVPITKTNQGGATAADYSGVPSSLVFNSGDTEKSFTFSATHDTVDDDDESVKLTFETLPIGVSRGTVRNTTVSITDDDVPAVTVSFGNHTYSVAESDDPDTADTAENELTIKVKLSADPERTVEVPIRVTKLFGATDDDFSGVPEKVTFNAGDTVKTFMLTATGDSIDDNGEGVMLTFGTLPNRVTSTGPSQAVVSITDDDTAGVTVTPTSLEVPEGSSGTYTVKLDTQPTGDVTITVGGISGTDLSLDETSLTFTKDSWNNAQTVTVSAGEDSDALDDSATLSHTVASDDDDVYHDLAAPGLDVTVLDNETETKTFTLNMAAPVHTDTDSSGDIDLGDTLAYTAVATNSGNVPLENVNVKDLLLDTSGTDCATLAIGAECKLTGVYTITQADVDAGEVKNTATATADGATPKGVTRTTDVDQVRKLTLEKTSTESGFGAKDDEIPYSYKATNSGTTTLKGTLTVTDDKVDTDDITCPTVPDEGLAPGAALTCTATYTVTQDDLDEGEVENTASASLGGVSSAEVSLTVAWRAPQSGQPTISIGSATDLEDAGTIHVTVRLSAASLQTITVDYATSDVTATAGADYTAASGTVSFSPGDITESVTVSITDDDIDEDTETLKVTLSDPVNATVPAGAEDGTISITDDDTAGVTVTPTSLEVTEGGNASYTVVLDSEPAGDVTVTPGGITDTDLSLDETTLTFTSSNWNEAQSVKVSAAHDDDSDDESVTITHTVASDDDSDYEGMSAGSVAVAIADDEDPQVKVSFEQSSYTVAEGSSVTVKVKLSADPERTVAISISKTNQGGATSSDYSGVPSSVTFNSGDTEKTFSFAASSDNVDDDDESVKLTFGALPTGVSEGTTKETVISITDDDVPQVTVSFENATYSVAESDDVDTIDVTENEVTVKVKLSADPERTVTVPISKTNQDGASDADYSGVPASVVFNSGDTEKSFTFTAAHDTVDDDDEKVKLTFGTLPARVSEGTTKETVISINDDDVPQVTVSFGATGYTVDEGSTVAVKVKLNKDPERTVAVPLTITHFDGVSGADYSGIPGSVTFQAGDTEKSFSFAATQDTVDDDGEYVLIGLGNLPHRVTTAAPSQTTVSITDDDVPAVTVNFGQASHTVAESDDADTSDVTENSVTITVKLDVDPGRTVTIPIIKNNQGGATAADYTGVPASVVFNSGETEKTFDFTATSDTVDDDDESVKLTFGALPAGVSEGTTKETVISITDDDDPAVTVSFGSAAYSVAETDDASTTDATENEVVIKVTLSADPERTVTIPITKNNQGGASSADYSGVPVSLEFNSGDTEKSFTFSATHDTVDDDDESVKLTFGTLPTGVSEGTTKEAVVSINDDDVPTVTVSFEKTAYSVDEGSSETIKVILSAKPERAVAITVAATLLDGAGVPDFTGAPATLNFGKDDTEKTITFAAYDDTLDDDGEGVRLTFAPLPTRVNAGTNSQATVSIVDDDDPAVTVSFGEAAYTVAESDDPDTSDVDENEVVIKVKLSADPERQVTVPITKTNQGGATAADYSGVPSSLVFNSGDTEKSFTFSATHDTVDDDDESVKLTFETLPIGVSRGTVRNTTVSITDDDVPAVTVSFGAASYPVAEGSSVTIKVKLSADPERTVEVPISKDNQNGASNADYSGVPASVTFSSGETEKTFSFAATNDSVDDDGEKVRLTFGSLPHRVGTTGPSQAVVSITDEDVPAVTVNFGQATHSVAESDDSDTSDVTENEVVIKVTLSADPERTVTIPITKNNQGGASNSDYSGVPANVVFNSGDTEKSFTFSVTHDTVDDDDESVKLTFGTLSTGVSEGTTKETVVTINDDDDPAVTVSFGSAAYSVAETDDASTTDATENEVVIKVTLSADPERAVTIPISKNNQGGASNSDYSGVPASVVFNSGDTEKSFTFSATHDTVDDDDESVKLTFGTLPAGVSEGSTKETVVSITDDDVPQVTVSFGGDGLHGRRRKHRGRQGQAQQGPGEDRRSSHHHHPL